MTIIVNSEKAVQHFIFRCPEQKDPGIKIKINWKYKETILCDFFAD